jgi:hypothetical protein
MFHSCLSLSGSSVSNGYREMGFYWLLQCNLLGERLVTLGLAGAGYLRSANPGDSTHDPHEHNLNASLHAPIFIPLPFPPSAMFAPLFLYSVVDSHWFHFESGPSFLSQFGSGSKEPNQCGSTWVRTGSGSWSVTKVEFYMKKVGKR